MSRLRKGQMKVYFDLDAIEEKKRLEMERKLQKLVEEYGFGFCACGADLNPREGETQRGRDMLFVKG